MQAVRNTLLFVNRIFAEISGWLLTAIMILLILDFVSRGLYRPIQGVGDLAVFVMVAIVYLGTAHTEQTHRHVRVTAVTSKLPLRWQHIINFLVYVLSTATMTIVVWAAAKNAIKAFKNQEAVAGTVPLWVWPVKFVIVIGCFFYLLQLLLNIRDEYQNISNHPK